MLLLSLACSDGGSITLEPVDTAAGLFEDDTGLEEEEEEEELGPSNALADSITIEGLMRHLEALQAIADETNETRAWTTEGHRDSREYVIKMLTEAGVEVHEQAFVYIDWEITEASLFAGEELDFSVFDGSPGGSASGDIVGVDLMLPPGAENSSTSGCQANDFADFPEGAIALIQRGSCTFGQKALNAEKAGATAVLIFNEGQQGRQGIVEGYLGEELSIPVLGLSFADGEALASTPTQGTIEVAGQLTEYDLVNVIAEIPGQEDSILLTGAHLDSVPAGPGINDNGSGSALVLEMALQASALEQPLHTLRFAWWDGEEYGLYGSIEYGDALGAQELDRHIAYLNFDMVASPNGVPFLYDGDGSNTGLDFGGAPAPKGSADIEHLLQDWYDGRALEYSEVSVDIPSDSYWFLYSDVPLGGVFTGADSRMTNQEAEIFGGEAGDPYDACYHQRCDDINNLDPDLFLLVGQSSGWLLGELMRLPE